LIEVELRSYLYLDPSFSLSKDFVKDELNVFEIAARAGVGVNIKIANQFLVGISAGYSNNFKENQKGFLDAGIESIIYLVHPEKISRLV
jgi:hypothetical protein